MHNAVMDGGTTQRSYRGPASRALGAEGDAIIERLLWLMNATIGASERPRSGKEASQPAGRIADDAEWRQFCAHIRRLIQLNARAGEAAATGEINRLMARYCSAPRIVAHDGSAPHLHFTPVGASPRGTLFADSVAALALLCMRGELRRLRTCESTICQRIYLDRSSNGSRRVCRVGPCLHTRGNRELTRT